MAFGFEAGRAGEINAEDVLKLAVGAGAPGVGGAEQGHDGFAEGGGDMHGSGVIRDEQPGEAKPLHHFGEGCGATQVQAVRRFGTRAWLAQVREL